MKKLFSHTSLKTLFLYGAFAASTYSIYGANQAIVKYGVPASTTSQITACLAGTLEELHRWQSDRSLSLRAVLPAEELKRALIDNQELSNDLMIVALEGYNRHWHPRGYVPAHKFSAKKTRFRYAIESLEGINTTAKKALYHELFYTDKKHTSGIFDLPPPEYISKANEFTLVPDLISEDIDKYLDESIERTEDGERIYTPSEKSKNRDKIIKDIEEASGCPLKELAIIRICLSEEKEQEESDKRKGEEPKLKASRRITLVVKQTDLVSAYITYRTNTDRVIGVDVLAAELSAAKEHDQTLRNEVEKLKTENARMQALIEDGKKLLEEKDSQYASIYQLCLTQQESYKGQLTITRQDFEKQIAAEQKRYNDTVKSHQSELQKQKDAHEQEIRALKLQLSQPAQVTTGRQMDGMLSVPTMNPKPYMPYNRQASSGYNQNHGSGIQPLLQTQANLPTEQVSHMQTTNTSNPTISCGCTTSTRSVAPFNTSQTYQMQSVTPGTAVNTQYPMQSTPYTAGNYPLNIAMSVPVQNAIQNMSRSEQMHSTQNQGTQNYLISSGYSPNTRSVASFTQPYQMQSVTHTNSTSSQHAGQQNRYPFFPNSEYPLNPSN